MTEEQTGIQRIKESTRDIFMWPMNFVRDFPKRSGRLLAAVQMLAQSNGSGNPVYRIQVILWYAFDIIGGPELIQIILRAVSTTRSLSHDEIKIAEEALGPRAIRFGDVRITTGGLLVFFYQMNNNRAFATWHTVNLPASRTEDVSLLVHELTHVLQYERIGSVYITQGLWAQYKYGIHAYDYGGAEGLLKSHAAGKRLSDYNREQQGQIAQDYVALVKKNRESEAYRPFIDDLHRGLI